MVTWATALLRGFRRSCPQCGQERMFQGYLTPKKNCSGCFLSFEDLKADDGPAYITMGLVCLLVVPFFFLFQARFEPSLEMALLISLPLTLVIILCLLPLVKGAFMAAVWKSGT